MKKKSIDQKFEPGRVATASGYTWNTRPGPAQTKCLTIQKLALVEINFYHFCNVSFCNVYLTPNI
jgi:hypothetical protein